MLVFSSATPWSLSFVWVEHGRSRLSLWRQESFISLPRDGVVQGCASAAKYAWHKVLLGIKMIQPRKQSHSGPLNCFTLETDVLHSKQSVVESSRRAEVEGSAAPTSSRIEKTNGSSFPEAPVRICY